MKISKEKLIEIIEEEILKILSEEKVETPRDAYLRGSKVAGAGRFIGPGGKEAYREKQCKKHWKRWGRWLPGYEDCADISPVSGDTGSHRDDTQDDRLDDLENRLHNAGIKEGKSNVNKWNPNITFGIDRLRSGSLKNIKDPHTRDALASLITIINNMNFEYHFNKAVENYLNKRNKE